MTFSLPFTIALCNGRLLVVIVGDEGDVAKKTCFVFKSVFSTALRSHWSWTTHIVFELLLTTAELVG